MLRAANVVPYFAVSATAILAGVFWLPIGTAKASEAPPMDLAGRTLSFPRTSAPVEEPQTASVRPPEPPRGSASLRRPRTRHTPLTIRREARVAKPVLATQVSAPPRKSSSTATSELSSAPAEVVARAQPSAHLDFDDVVERFESDPSRFPIDRSVRKDGVTLSLEGLVRLEEHYVLKVSVSNETAADFFVKDFAVLVGSRVLSSRGAFRILVEPRRERSGYIVFEKPAPGTAVQIKLTEDKGNGRVVEVALPYPF